MATKYRKSCTAVVKQVYQELFNHEIHVGATHGGLECGLIMDKFPSLDAISIGNDSISTLAK